MMRGRSFAHWPLQGAGVGHFSTSVSFSGGSKDFGVEFNRLASLSVDAAHALGDLEPQGDGSARCSDPSLRQASCQRHHEARPPRAFQSRLQSASSCDWRLATGVPLVALRAGHAEESALRVELDLLAVEHGLLASACRHRAAQDTVQAPTPDGEISV